LKTIPRMDKRTIRNHHRSRQSPILEIPSKPQSMNREMARRPPRIRLPNQIYPREHEHPSRCPI
jgi:hypothetical protein